MNGKLRKTEPDCGEIRELLDLLAAGDLPDAEAERCRRHIDSCPECRAAFTRAGEAAGKVQSALSASVPAQSELMDLWPSVREKVTRPRQPIFGWFNLEPVRSLLVAGILTVGLYMTINIQDTNYSKNGSPFPVYESNPVTVSTARVDERPARVSGIESGDGSTVFLWLE